MKGWFKKWLGEAVLFLAVAGALYSAWLIWDTHLGVEFRDAFPVQENVRDSDGL